MNIASAKTKTASYTAADIMQRNVVTISPRETLRDAVSSLTFHQVSGLPVIDDDSKCVGVISAADILTFEDEFALGIDGRNQIVGSYFDPITLQWDMVRMMGESEALEGVTVREEMSPDLVSVLPEANLLEVAELMLSRKVHRVLVINDKRELQGVVSATDFLQMFVNQRTAFPTDSNGE